MMLNRVYDVARNEARRGRPQIATIHGSDQREEMIAMQCRKSGLPFPNLHIGVLDGRVDLRRSIACPPAAKPKSRQAVNNAGSPAGMPCWIKPLQYGRPECRTEAGHMIRSIWR